MPAERQSSGVTASTSTFALSVTVNLGTVDGRLALVFLATRDYDLTAFTLTSLTCGGTPLTLWTDFSFGGLKQAIYYLVNPPTGNQVIEADFSDLASGGLAVVCYRGVDTDNPLGPVQTANATSTTPSTTDSLSTQDALFTGLVVDYAGTRPSVTATNGQTVNTTPIEYDVSHNFLFSFGQRQLQPQGSAVADSYSLSISNAWRMASAVINHRQAGAAPTYLLGV